MNNLNWTPVDSSNVHSLAYEAKSQTLAVKFHNGGLYTYSGVAIEVYTALQHAPSVGRYLNQSVKALHPYIKWGTEGDLNSYLETARATV